MSFNAPQLLGIGASGAIQALLTTALIISVRLPKGSRRAWTQALPIVIGVPALIPVVQLPGALSIDRADHVGGTIAGVLMGLAIAFAWRDGVIRRPGRRTALAFGGIAAATLLLPIPFTGWQDPTLIAHLVPPADLPTTEAAWRKRGGDLARLYPDDPRAVLGLATSEIRSGQTAAGLVDLDRAIALQQRLAPSASRSFRFQAHAEVGGELFNAGKLDETITQYGLALADNPSAEIFRNRGIAEFYDRKRPDALEDLRRAKATDPTEGYSVLWLSIVAVRSGQPDPIASAAGEVKRDWPDKIVAFYDGKLDAEMAAAWGATLDLASDQHRVCEAKFYQGEHLIMRGSNDEARPLIQETVDTCPHDFIEYRAALEELAGAAGFPTN